MVLFARVRELGASVCLYESVCLVKGNIDIHIYHIISYHNLIAMRARVYREYFMNCWQTWPLSTMRVYTQMYNNENKMPCAYERLQHGISIVKLNLFLTILNALNRIFSILCLHCIFSPYLK